MNDIGQQFVDAATAFKEQTLTEPRKACMAPETFQRLTSRLQTQMYAGIKITLDDTMMFGEIVFFSHEE